MESSKARWFSLQVVRVKVKAQKESVTDFMQAYSAPWRVTRRDGVCMIISKPEAQRASVTDFRYSVITAVPRRDCRLHTLSD